MLFLILTGVLFNLIAFFIPKRMSDLEIITTTLFSMVLELLVDMYLDVKFDMFGYFTKGVNWGFLIYVFGVYPAINITFLNFFPYNKSLVRKYCYIVGWSVFAVIFELLFIWTKTFYYNGWKLWYSALCYPALYVTLVLFDKYTLYLIKKVQQKTHP
ncbi:hypothetical protein HPT25_26445 [Bacillus sp. BRMEA1]|uniref:CBO0543 family protein n=1 Tax=Neobacillus endophyticus TaxID=2738405 RepID=UPI001563CC1A|nr:CBO0543 family protein [Neobacillus endophyticus]NRD80872.1 hypothetical protein [Neobacillus endophyticus]